MQFGNESGELRQKAINLMYLVVLALLFSFIPSDFIDSVFHSNQTFQETIDQNEIQQTRANLLFLKFLENDEFIYNDTKGRMISIEDHSAEVLELIENIRSELLIQSEDGATSYPADGGKEERTRAVMIDDHRGDTLFNELSSFKKKISSFLPAGSMGVLDSLLPIGTEMHRSNGKDESLVDFYFKNTPLNVTLLNLTHFEAQVQRTKIYALNQVLQDAFNQNKEQLPLDVLTVFETSDQSLSKKNAIKDFFDQLEVAELLSELRKKKRESSSYLHVQSLTDSIYPAGRPLRFKVYFDTLFTDHVNVKVNSIYGFTDYVLHRPGDFMYVPEKKGTYTISFENHKFNTKKSFSVIDVEPILQSDRYGTLYTGVDNALRIETSEFEDTRNLIARTNNGSVVKRGSKFFVRVSEKKLTTVKVYARMPYGLIKIAEKSFLVKESDLPDFGITSAKNNETIDISELTSSNSLALSEEGIEQGYEIASFQLSLIYNDHTSITPPIIHNSGIFQQEAIQVLSHAKPGDIVMIEKVTLRSQAGEIIKAGNLRIEVKP